MSAPMHYRRGPRRVLHSHIDRAYYNTTRKPEKKKRRHTHKRMDGEGGRDMKETVAAAHGARRCYTHKHIIRKGGREGHGRLKQTAAFMAPAATRASILYGREGGIKRERLHINEIGRAFF